jgi:ribosomal protein L23
MDLVKTLEKNQKLHIQIVVVTLKVTSCRTMCKKKSDKKVKNQDFMGKTNYFLRTLPFTPWAVSATWLHVGAP